MGELNKRSISIVVKPLTDGEAPPILVYHFPVVTGASSHDERELKWAS